MRLTEFMGLKPSKKDIELIDAIKSSNLQVLGRGTVRVELKKNSDISNIQQKVKTLFPKRYEKK